jgi:UDP-glucose 4-epimerase
VSKINIYNLGVNDTCKVRDSVDWITNELQLSPQVIYEKQKRGWIGDIPLIHLDVQKIEKLGWAPKFTIEESIRDTVKFLQTNSWIFGDNE